MTNSPILDEIYRIEYQALAKHLHIMKFSGSIEPTLFNIRLALEKVITPKLNKTNNCSFSKKACLNLIKPNELYSFVENESFPDEILNLINIKNSIATYVIIEHSDDLDVAWLILKSKEFFVVYFDYSD